MKRICCFVFMILLLLKNFFAFDRFPKVISTRDHTDTKFDCTEMVNDLLKSILKDNITFSKHFLLSNPSLNLELTLQGDLQNASKTVVNVCEFDNNNNVNTTVDLTIETINYNGSYIMNGLAIQLLPIFGHGSIQLKLDELKLTTSLAITPLSGILFVDKFTFYFGVNKIEVSIEGLLDEPEVSALLNKFLGDFIPLVVNRLNVKLSNAIQNLVNNDPSLNRMELNDVVKIVKLLL